MHAAERAELIVGAVRGRLVVTTEELARLCKASGETVRRDLLLLEEQGRLIRVHGGAAPLPDQIGVEPTFVERLAADPAKDAIGRAGASLIRPGDTVVFDVGTSALAVARAMPADFRGLVATCSLPVAAELAGRAEVLVAAGRVRAGDLAVSGASTVAYFDDLNADIAFLGSGGVDIERGVTDFHLDEIATRWAMMRRATRSYVLADAAKFGRIAPHRVCALDEITGLITDRSPHPELLAAAERAGATVIAA